MLITGKTNLQPLVFIAGGTNGKITHKVSQNFAKYCFSDEEQRSPCNRVFIDLKRVRVKRIAISRPVSGIKNLYSIGLITFENLTRSNTS